MQASGAARTETELKQQGLLGHLSSWRRRPRQEVQAEVPAAVPHSRRVEDNCMSLCANSTSLRGLSLCQAGAQRPLRSRPPSSPPSATMAVTSVVGTMTTPAQRAAQPASAPTWWAARPQAQAHPAGAGAEAAPIAAAKPWPAPVSLLAGRLQALCSAALPALRAPLQRQRSGSAWSRAAAQALALDSTAEAQDVFSALVLCEAIYRCQDFGPDMVRARAGAGWGAGRLPAGREQLRRTTDTWRRGRASKWGVRYPASPTPLPRLG